MQIIAFPFAGGNKYSFNNLFSGNCNISTHEYPGRGLRISENLIRNIDELISNLFSGVRDQIDSCDEYVIYGHSMGALVGYLICQKIEELNLKRPNKLIVCGAKSPNSFRQKIISNLKDKDFWNEGVHLAWANTINGGQDVYYTHISPENILGLNDISESIL